MKILLFLFISISAFSQETISQFNPVAVYKTGDYLKQIGFPDNTVFKTQLFQKPDCERNESITEWIAESRGSDICMHAVHWIYAEYEDLNKKSNIVNAVYCGCGCPYTEHEARICEQCKRHETRVKSISYSLKVKKSKYMQLLESLKN